MVNNHLNFHILKVVRLYVTLKKSKDILIAQYYKSEMESVSCTMLFDGKKFGCTKTK
jgi:hypothetical protein